LSRSLNVLVGCEYSGAVSGAFRALGHAAFSCDLLPADNGDTRFHYQRDVFDVLEREGPWDLAIFHPPCTYLCSSGLHWNKRRPDRAAQTEEALEFVRRLMACGVPHWALENPMGCISTRIRKYDDLIQPWQFGDDASKATCLWTHNLPKLVPTQIVPPRIVDGKKRWGNQTDSGQNRLPPSADRWKLRSATYPGIAQAMAVQYSQHILRNT
jgi:hypothetical protein